MHSRIYAGACTLQMIGRRKTKDGMISTTTHGKVLRRVLRTTKENLVCSRMDIIYDGRPWWISGDAWLQKSCIAGWYHSPLTIGPESKSICTGATLHTLCFTNCPLATYKLFARAYGGKSDSSLYHINDNTITKQKWINLYDILLDSFKGSGRCVSMD